MNERYSIKFWHWMLLGLLTFFAFFYGIGDYAILNLNEGLYAEIAREMLATHQYIIPHLNGVPYLEKPPLFYWLLVLSYKIFGVSTFAARLVPSLSGTSNILFLIFFSNRLKLLRIGWISGILLSSSIGFILISRIVFFDMLLTAFLSSALGCFYLWYEKEKFAYLIAAYVLLGCAVLTKGFLPLILAGAIALIFLLGTQSRSKIIKLFHPLGLLILLLIIIPWHILACFKLPGFASDYFINEQVYRFLDKRIPQDYHTGPFYYYIPRVLFYLFPWTAILFMSRKFFKTRLELFLSLSILIPLLFFSLSKAKGDYYMVITMPLLAFFIALKIDQFLTRSHDIFKYIFLSFGFILLISFVVVFKNFLIIPNLILLFYYIAFGLLIFYYRNCLFSFLATAGLIWPVVFAYVYFEKNYQDIYSEKAIADYMQKQHDLRPVYLFKDYEKISSLMFLLQQTAVVIDTQSQDLYFGSRTQEAQGKFISAYDFTKRFYQGPVYLVVRYDKNQACLNTFTGLPLKLVFQTQTTYLYSN